ncbi:HIRAN domain-containing protein [Actinokineospora alba]|uniref:HIRAN domain-containing protein n=1 Tax=Actinokineospora alba TaxID=504798 RepID=UPI000B8472FD|nr:HIRAN domain-containing protein [Actinokineospora alba]
MRHRIVAVLVPEPTNAYDANVISVHVDGRVVGYLPRDIAAQYLPALHGLMKLAGGHVALDGVIVGGGYYENGPGRLGVWLSHDAETFGGRSGRAGQPSNALEPSMRTGFSEAWRTDAEDDSYDLSWYSSLPVGDRQAVAALRVLLAAERDPIDRHFQFAELEARLYRCRELYDTALDEFDDACRQHDAEMETICQSFMAKWNKVPLLETYRQMAIRQQKNKDWDTCLWWAERGLELYGNDAAREDAVEDLLKRRNQALAKIEARQAPK